MPTSDIKKGPLYVDSTNNNVGIGTSSPYSRFTVKTSGNGYVDGLVIEDADSTTRSAITHVNSVLYFSGNTTADHMVITSAGNVGIGTASPYVNLESYVSATGAIPTNEAVGVAGGSSNVAIGAFNANNSATFSGIALETRTSGASRWLIANEWKNTYVGDLVFRSRNGGTTSQESMRIDSSGRVTMPYQPSFRAKGNNAGYISTSPVPFGNVQHNIGGHFSTSTNRFTAPIAGIYSLHAHLGVVRVTTTSGWAQGELRVNGAQIAYSYFQTASPTEFGNLNISALASLAAGDYVEVIFQDSGGSYYNGGSESQFSGYLVS